MEENNSIEQEKCANCGNQPDDILMLECQHDLCLECAKKTILDKETVQELENMHHENQKNPIYKSSNKQSNKSNFTSNHHSQQQSYAQTIQNSPLIVFPQNSNFNDEFFSASIQKENLDINNSKSTINSRKYCQEHPEEETTYFCFTCQGSCICPECIIHGSHKNHDVKTTRKSFPVIRDQMLDWINKLNVQTKRVVQKKEEYQNIKRELKSQNKNQKQLVVSFFDEIKQKLDLKEKEIFQTLDFQLDSFLKCIDSQINVSEQEQNSIKTSIEMLDQTSKSQEEIGTLNFFARNKQKINQILQKDFVSEKQLIFEEQVDMQLIQNQLKEISNSIQSLVFSGINENKNEIIVINKPNFYQQNSTAFQENINSSNLIQSNLYNNKNPLIQNDKNKENQTNNTIYHQKSLSSLNNQPESDRSILSSVTQLSNQIVDRVQSTRKTSELNKLNAQDFLRVKELALKHKGLNFMQKKLFKQTSPSIASDQENHVLD